MLGLRDLRLGLGRRDSGPGNWFCGTRGVMWQDQAGDEICARGLSLTWQGSWARGLEWASASTSLLPAAGPSGPVSGRPPWPQSEPWAPCWVMTYICTFPAAATVEVASSFHRPGARAGGDKGSRPKLP